MVFQLNLDYVRTNRGMILTAETVFGLIGGIVSAVVFNGFMSFCSWSTLILSGTLLGLNVLNAYEALRSKFEIMTKVELGYVAIWTGFYAIAVILSIIGFSIANIIGYVQLVLFILDGVMHFRVYRSGAASGGAPPADAETAGY